MTIEIIGNWYSPLNYLKSLKSTEKAGLLDETSSAGDWTGFVVRKVRKKFYVYFFSQENNGSGFNLEVAKKEFAIFSSLPSFEDVEELALRYFS